MSSATHSLTLTAGRYGARRRQWNTRGGRTRAPRSVTIAPWQGAESLPPDGTPGGTPSDRAPATPHTVTVRLPVMAMSGVFPAQEKVLWACSDALATWGLWSAAAQFGQRAAICEVLEGTDRLELGWRLLRAGRPQDALRCLADLADDAHPVLPALRATALAARDQTPESLTGVMRILGDYPPTPLGLRMVVIAAGAVGDAATALDAAARLLATVDADDPQMRRLLAAPQANAGDVTAAVASAEAASMGRPDDPAAPVREIAEEIRRGGRDDILCRFLAEGYHRTGRQVYGQLLEQVLPWRVRNRNRVVGIGLCVLLTGIGWGLVGAGVLSDISLGAGILIGLSALLGATLLRAPQASFRRTNRIYQAYAVSRSRRGTSEVVLPAVGVVTGVFATAILFSRGNQGAVPAPTLLAVLGASLAAGAIGVIAGRERRRRRLLAAQPVPMEQDRCRCWEMDLLAGPQWQRYMTEHLQELAAEESLDAVWRRCATTDKTWLHLPSNDLAVSVRRPAPGPDPETPIGQYL